MHLLLAQLEQYLKYLDIKCLGIKEVKNDLGSKNLSNLREFESCRYQNQNMYLFHRFKSMK